MLRRVVEVALNPVLSVVSAELQAILRLLAVGTEPRKVAARALRAAMTV